MNANKKNLEMFKLEDRVLFDAAAAVEIVEADQQATDPNPNAQQSESDRQAKEDRETLKNAGPVDSAADHQDAGEPVYDGGIADVDAASEALINGDVGALADYFNQPVMTRVTIDPASQASLSSLADDSLVIVDATLPGSESLLASAEAQGRDVLVLDEGDGLDDVLAYLQNSGKEYGSMHFFSHANKAGVIKLGADTITDADIRAEAWREVGEYLTNDGDLMFYGCELGQNGAGRTVARQIAELADADVAISDDVTGVHGDWDLEYQIGDVNHEVFIPDSYDYDLAATKIVTVEVAEDATDYTYDGEDMNLREAIQVVNSDYYGTGYEFYQDGAADADQSNKHFNLVAHTGTDGNIDYYTLQDEVYDASKTDAENAGHFEKFYANLTSEGKILYWNVEDVAKLTNPDYTTLKALEVSYSGASVSGFSIGNIETNTFELTTADLGEGGTLTMATGNIINKVVYKTNADYQKTYEIQFAKDAQKEANVLKWGLDAITRDHVTINGEDKAVISVDDATSFTIFTNESTGLTLKGLEISEAGKSAIYNKAGASLTIENTILKNNDADQGGAIYNVSGAGLALRNATFSGNAADEGGAIYLENGADLTSEGATFEYNLADKGGAIYLKGGTLGIDNTYHFNANAADTAGGAIYANTGANLVIAGGEFVGNYEFNTAASKGGAVYAATGLNVTGGTFEGNLAGYHTADGNVLYIVNGADFGVEGYAYLEVKDDESDDFARVLTADGQVIGLVADDPVTDETVFVTLTVKETTVKGDDDVETVVKSVESAKDAAGEDVSDALLAKIQAKFNDTAAGQKLFAAVMGKVLVGQGGAVYVEKGTALSLGAAKFIGNLAKEGGALYANRDVTVGAARFTGNEAETKGGAIYLNAVNFMVKDDAVFAKNAADKGGAVYTSELTRTVELNAALFDGNSALHDGGALYFAEGVAKIALASTTFTANAAENGGALYTPTTASVTFKYTVFSGNTATQDGGALYSNGSSYSFTRENTFSGNRAVRDGGAVKLGLGSVAMMTDMTFEGNTAGGKGGAVASDDAVLTVTGATFKGNAAAKGGAVQIVSGLNKDAIATFTDSSFEGNAADQGGAMFLEMNTGMIPAVVKIDETSFSGNAAYSFGGAIYNDARVTTVVKNSVFVDNLLTSDKFDFETAMLKYVLNGSNDDFIVVGKENVFTAVLAGAAITNAGNFTSYQNAYLSNKGSDAFVKYYNNDRNRLVEYVKDAETGALILPEQTITKDSVQYTLTRTSDTEITVKYIEPADPTDSDAEDEEKTFTYTLDEETGEIECSDAEMESLFDAKIIRNQLAYRNLDGTVFTPEQWLDVPDDPETTDEDETEQKDYWAIGDLGDSVKADDVVIVQMKVVTSGGAFATVADGATTSLVSNTLYDNAAGQGGAMYQGGVYQDGVLTRCHIKDGVVSDASSTVGPMTTLRVNVVDTTIAGNTSFEEDGYAFQSLDGKAMLLNAIVAANRRGKADGSLDFEITAHYNDAGEIVYDFGESTDKTLDEVKTAFFADFATGTGDISAPASSNLEIYYSVLGEFGGGVETADYVKVDANGFYLDAANAWLDADRANVSVTADDVKFALWQALFVKKDAASELLVPTEVEARQLAQNLTDVTAWYDAMSVAVAKLEVVDPEDASENDGYNWLKGVLDGFKTTKVDGATDSRTLRADMQAFIVQLEALTDEQGGDNESMADARKALKDALLETDYVETDVSITVDLGGDYGATAMFDLVFGKTKAEATDEISVRADGEALAYDDVLISIDNLHAGMDVHGLTDDERSADLENYEVGSDFTAERVTNYIGTNVKRDEQGTLTDRTYAEDEDAPADAFGLTTVEKVRVFAYGTDSSSTVSISPAAYYQSALVKVSSDNNGAIIAVAYAKPVADNTGVVYNQGATVERIRATDANYNPVYGGSATDIIDVDQRNFSSTFFNYARGAWWQDGAAKLIEALVVTQKGDETGWNTSNGLTFSELIYGIEHGIVAANIDLDQDGVYEGYKITFDESLFTDGKYTLTVDSAFKLTGNKISETTKKPLFAEGSSYNLVIDGGSDPARELTIRALTDGCCDFIDATNAALAFNLQLQHLTIKGFNTAIKVNGTDGTKQVTNYYNADGTHQKLYSTITVEDTTITGSKAGAINLNKGSVYVIGKSAFTNNQGGAITVGSGQVVLGIAEGVDIDHTVTYGTPDTITFSGNTGVKGGAICVTQAAVEADSTYQLAAHKAGIYMEGVQSVVFENNAATDGEGGALWVKGNINITANQIDITGNTATGTKGGSIYAEGDVSLQLYGSSRLSKISGNKVVGENEAKGGAIYAEGKVTIGSKAAGAFFNIDNNHVQVKGIEGDIVAQGGAIWGGSIELKDVTSVVGNTASGRDLKTGEKTLADADKIKGNLTAQGGAFYSKGDFSSTMTIAEVEGYWSDNSVNFSLADTTLITSKTLGGTSSKVGDGSVIAEGGAVYAGGNMILSDVYAYKNELSVTFGKNGLRTKPISVLGGFAAAKGNLSFYSGEVSQSRIKISATGALKNATIAGGALYAHGDLELSHTTNTMTNNAPGSGVSSNGISVDLTLRGGELSNLQNVTISGGAAHADGNVDVRNAKIMKNFVNLAARKDGADSLVWAQNVTVQGGAVAGKAGSVNDTALTYNYVIVDANSGDDNVLKLDNVAILGGAVALGGKDQPTSMANVYAEDNYIEVKLKGKRVTTFNAAHESTESSEGLIVRGGQLYANGPVTGSRLTVIGSGATNTLGINVDGFLGKKNSGFNKRDWFNLTAEGGGAYFGGDTNLSNASFVDNNINVDLRNSGEWAYVGNINLHGGQLAAMGALTIADKLAPAKDYKGDALITPSKLVNARNAAIRLSGTSFAGGMIGTIDARGGGAYAKNDVVVSQYATATVGDYTIDITNNDITVDIDSFAGDVMARNNGMGLFAEMAIQMLAQTKFNLELGMATDSMDGSGLDFGSFGNTKFGGFLKDAFDAILKAINGALNLSRFNFSIDHTNVEGGGIYGGGTMKLTGVDATKNDLNVSYKSAFKSGTTRFILDNVDVLGAGVMAEGDLTVTKSTFNQNSITANVISESSGGTVFSAAFGILGVGKTSTSAGLVFFKGLNAKGGGAYTGGALKATDSEFNNNHIDVSVTCAAKDNVASAVFTWLDAVPGFAGILVNMINNGAINVDSDALLWMDYLNAEGAGAYAGGESATVITKCQFIGNTISASALATTEGSSAIANAIVTKAQYLTEDQKLGIGHTIDGVNSESIATADADVIVETYNVRGGGLFANGNVTYTEKCELTSNDLKASLVADATGGCVTATATYLQVLISNTLKPAETFIVRLGAEATAHKDAYVDELRSITAYVPVLPIGGGADGFIWRIDKGFYGRPMVQGPFYLDGASGWWMLDGATFVVQGAAFDANYTTGQNVDLIISGNTISVAEAKAKTGSVPIAITATSFFLTQLPGVPYPLMVPTIFTVDIDIEVAEAHQCAYNYFHGSTSYGQFKDCFKVGDIGTDQNPGVDRAAWTTVCSRECWAGAGKAEDLFYIPGLTITTLPVHAFQVGGFVIPIPWVSMLGPVPMVFMNLVVPPMGIWATYTSNGILYLPMSPAACAAALIDIGMNAAVALAANSVVSAVTNIGGFCEGAVPGTAVATGASTGGDANGASASAGASVTDGSLTFKRAIVDKDGNVTGYDDVTVDLTQLALVAQAAGILDISITNGSAVNKSNADSTAAEKANSTTRVRDIKNTSEDVTIAFSSVHDDATDTDTVTLGDVTLVWHNDGDDSKWTVDGEDVTDETAVLPKLSDDTTCFTLKNGEDKFDGKIYIVDAEGEKTKVTGNVTLQAKTLDSVTAFWDKANSAWLTADNAADTVTLEDDGTMSFKAVDEAHKDKGVGDDEVRIYTLDGKDYWYDLTTGAWIDTLPDGYKAVSGETGLLAPNGDQVMAYSKAAETYVNLTTGELYGTRETKVVYATDTTPGKVVTTYNLADGTKATQEIALDPAGSGVTVSTYDANLNTIVTEVAANGNLKSTFHDFAKKEYNVTETSTAKNADGSYATTNKCSTYGEENDGTMAAAAKDVTYVTTEVDKDGQMLALQQITNENFDGADSDHKKGTYEVELGTVYLDKDGKETTKDKAYEVTTKTETHTYDYEIWHVNSMDGFAADGGSNKHTSEVQQYWHYLDTDGNDCYVPCVEQVPADTAYNSVYLLVAEAQETVSPTYTDAQMGYVGDGDYYENGDGYQYIHKVTGPTDYLVDGNYYESRVEGSHVESYWQPLYDPAGNPFVLEGFKPEKGTTGINRTTGYPEGVLCKITTTTDQVKTDQTTTFNGETVPVYKTVSSTAAALVADSDGNQLHVKTEMLDLTDDGVDNPTEYWVIVGGEHDGETFVNSGGNPITDGDGYAIIMSTDMYGKAPTEDGYVGPMTIDGRPACGFGEADSNIAFTYDSDGNIDGIIWVGEGYELLDSAGTDSATKDGLDMFYDVVVGQTVTEVINHPAEEAKYVDDDPTKEEISPAKEAWTEVKTEDITMKYFIDSDGTLRSQNGQDTFTYNTCEWSETDGKFVTVEHTGECCVVMKYILTDVDGVTSAVKTVVCENGKPVVSSLLDGEQVIQLGDRQYALYISESNYGLETTTEGYVGPATTDGQAANPGAKGNTISFDETGKLAKSTIEIDTDGDKVADKILKFVLPGYDADGKLVYCDVDESDTSDLANKAVYVKTVKTETKTVEVVVKDNFGQPVYDGGKLVTKDVKQTIVYQEIIAECDGEVQTKHIDAYTDAKTGEPVAAHDVTYATFKAVDTFDRKALLAYETVKTADAGEGKLKLTADSTTHEITTETKNIASTRIEQKSYQALYKADSDTLNTLGVNTTDTVIVEVDGASGEMKVDTDGLPSNLVYNKSIDKLGEGETRQVEKDNCGHVIYSTYKGQEVTVRTYSDGTYIFDDEGGATYTASVNGYNVIFTTGNDGLLNVGEGGMPVEVETKSVKTEVTVSSYSDSNGDHSTTSTSIDTDYTATTDGNGHVVYGDGTTVTLKLVLPEEKSTGPDKTVNTSYEVSVADNVAAYLVVDETTGNVSVKVAQDVNGNAVYENAARLTIAQAQKQEEVPPTQPEQEPTTKMVDVVSADNKVVYEIKPFDEDGLSVYFKDFYDTENTNKDIADAAKKVKESDAAAGYEKIILTDKDGNALKVKDSDENVIAYKNLQTGLIYNSEGIVLNALTDDTGAVVYDIDGLTYKDADGNLVTDIAGNVIYTAQSLKFGGVTVTNAHVEVGVNGQVVTRSLVDPVTHAVVKVPTCLMTIKTATGEKFACNSDGSAIYNELDADGDRYLDKDGSPSNIWTNAQGEPILDSTGHAVYIALDDTGTPQLNSDGTPANVANIDKLDKEPVQYYATNELGRVIKDRAGNKILIESDPETNQPLYDENGLPTTVLKRANGTMVYDDAGNVIYLTMADDGLAVWTAYDAEGNVIVSELDDTGAEVWKQYDADGKTVINENATFDHYENTKLLTADAITVDEADPNKGTLDLGSTYGMKSLVKSEAGVWYVDIGSTPGEQDPKDMRLETQTYETDHGTITLVSDGFGNVLYRTSKFDGSVSSVSGMVPSETLATPYDTTTNDYRAADGSEKDTADIIYVTMASGKNTPEVQGTLAYALANGAGKTIKFADGLFTGGKAVILVEDTLTIGANVKLDAGEGRELVIRTSEPGLWFAAGYQDDSQAWIEANGKIVNQETQDREPPVSYVFAPDYSLFSITTNVTSIEVTNITFEGGHVTDAGAVFNAAGERTAELTLTLNGSNIFRSNADNNGGAIYVNGDLALVMANNAQIAVNNGAEGGAIYANGSVSIEGDGMLVRNTTEQANGGAVSARGSVELDGTLEFVANVAKGDGGAVYSVAGSDAVVTMTDGVVFALNTAAGRGGALFIKTTAGSTNLTVDTARFLGNEAGAEGGALYIEAATRENRMDVNDADFTGNKSGKSGGAVFFETTGTLSGTAGKAAEVFFNAENARFDSNVAAGNGGAIEASYGRITLKGAGTVVTDNIAQGTGGAIDAGGVVTIGKGVMFDGNTAGTAGGAIALSDGQMSITSATFDGNASHGEGGAVAILKDALSVTIISSAFMVNNAANAGGAVYSSANEALIVNRKSTYNANSVGNGQGGAVAIAGGEYQASGNIYFANRAATDGGAISVTGENASAIVKSSKFYDNSAVDAGGAVYAGDKANAVVSNSTFGSGTDVGYVTSSGLGNTAKTGGAIAVESSATLAIGIKGSTGSAKTRIENTTAELGGAIYVNGGNLKSYETLELTGNKAQDGAAIYATTNDAYQTATVELSGKTVITGSETVDKGTIYMGGKATLAFNGETTIGGDEPTDVNTANQGGAIYFADSSHVDFNAKTTVKNNTANDAGAAFYVASSGEFSVNTKLVSVVGNNGYGTFYIGKNAEGQAAQANFSEASFEDATGDDYIVVEGYLAFNQSSVVGGGITVLSGGELAIANSTITLSSDYGVNVLTGAKAAIVNASIVNNAVAGINAQGDVLLLNSIVVGNGNVDISGTTRGGSVFYGTTDGTVANDGDRNRADQTYRDAFLSSGLHTDANGTKYYMVKAGEPVQESGSRVTGGKDGVYVDKKAGVHNGVANIFVKDLDYDQRGVHRTENVFGAVIDIFANQNENTAAGTTNNNYSVMDGVKTPADKTSSFGESMSKQADVREAADSGVMGYDTNGGQVAFVANESVRSAGDVHSGYAFSAVEAGLMMSGDSLDVLGSDSGDVGGDSVPSIISNYAAAMAATNSSPIGGLAKASSFASDFENALEELFGK